MSNVVHSTTAIHEIDDDIPTKDVISDDGLCVALWFGALAISSFESVDMEQASGAWFSILIDFDKLRQRH